MNNNILISTGVLNTYWEQNHKDTLDLLMPFLRYSIAMSARVGEEISVDQISDYFKTEFGYEDVPLSVITAMLNRLSPSTLKRSRNKYQLLVPLDKEASEFNKKRTEWKARREIVTNALKEHLKANIGGKSYSDDVISEYLYDFFVANGLIVAKDINKLSGLKRKDNKINYEIARFIVDESKKASAIFDYIGEMVKGFFVSTAISIQTPTNTTINSKFKSFSCFIDTRIIIDALGLHLPEAKRSAIEFLEMLNKAGAKLFCFENNYQEISDVLSAYKYGLTNYKKRSPLNTLEFFDEHGYTVSDVERFQSVLRVRIHSLGITIMPQPSYDGNHSWDAFINEKGLKEFLGQNVKYNSQMALETDVAAAASIMLLRNGYSSQEIEKSKYLFVSSNVPYVRATCKYLNQSISTAVPAVIEDINLAALLWLKNANTHKDYPKTKLIENAMLALEPTPQFMTNLFETLDKISAEGIISEDEAAIIRVDTYCKRELVRLTKGDSLEIDSDDIIDVRNRLRLQYVGEESQLSRLNYEKYQSEKAANESAVRAALDKIELAGDEAKEKTTRQWNFIVLALRILLLALAAAGIAYGLNVDSVVSIVLGGVSGVLDAWGVIDLINGKMQNVQRFINRKALSSADDAMDKKRIEYEEILGSFIKE